MGVPPVSGASIPGNESLGRDVEALLYVPPTSRSCARFESECSCTQRAKSDWCNPSTDNNRTWLMPFGRPEPLGAAKVVAVVAVVATTADNAASAAPMITVRAHVSMLNLRSCAEGAQRTDRE